MKSIIKFLFFIPLRRILRFIGYDLFKSEQVLSYDEIYYHLFNKEYKTKQLVVFDVGAHKGESVKRFKKIFPSSEIHSFEPDPKIFKIIDLNTREYNRNKKTVYCNNFGLGEKADEKIFYRNAKTNTSSFHAVNIESEWAHKRSISRVGDVTKFTTNQLKLKIDTLDNYVAKNNINNINILKIDTQAFNANVLMGAIESLKKNQIDVIETEVILGDAYEHQEQIYDFENILIPLGYTLAAIAHDLNKVCSLQRNDNHLHLQKNLFLQTDLLLELIFVRKELIPQKSFSAKYIK